MSVTSVAEVKKSRSVSKSRSWLASAPDEDGRLSMRMPSTCSKMRLEMMTSAFLPATSTK